MPTSFNPAEAPWRAGLRGARANLAPGLVLQLLALLIVVAYYQHAPSQRAINALAHLHERAGVMFGIVSTGLCGGVIPFLYLRCRRATRDRFTLAGGATLIAFWAYKGLEVDLWYRFLAFVVGSGNEVGTVVTKMALDQFVYCPVFAVPVTVVVYEWIETRFRGTVLLADMRQGQWYRRRVLPVLLSNLGVWVPAVCIIYALPTPLQLPLQNLVLCFFTLLLATISARPTARR
ncbi:hypothetical protein [Opitutus sp. ER46]|uniref:hypothetical protein n=1 Tax=Opitutus sp. ER46 TaxID=2161864 RepID=UPI000D300240|nr:hypothetical protein [Opitutus sp. ER46]PTY01150.1 hypothetical protein DB354_00465 [Opitutus sp. ER46]